MIDQEVLASVIGEDFVASVVSVMPKSSVVSLGARGVCSDTEEVNSGLSSP